MPPDKSFDLRRGHQLLTLIAAGEMLSRHFKPNTLAKLIRVMKSLGLVQPAHRDKVRYELTKKGVEALALLNQIIALTQAEKE